MDLFKVFTIASSIYNLLCCHTIWCLQGGSFHYNYSCVPSNFMANRRVPIFSLNNCAQSSKKPFMCAKFHTNPVIKYTQCHISTNLSNFLKLCLLYCQKLFTLAPTNRQFAEKTGLVGTLNYSVLVQL